MMPRKQKRTDGQGLALQELVCDCGNDDQNRFFSVLTDGNPRRRPSLVGWRCHDCGKVLPHPAHNSV